MSIASAEGTMPLGEDLVTFLKAQRGGERRRMERDGRPGTHERAVARGGSRSRQSGNPTKSFAPLETVFDACRQTPAGVSVDRVSRIHRCSRRGFGRDHQSSEPVREERGRRSNSELQTPMDTPESNGVWMSRNDPRQRRTPKIPEGSIRALRNQRKDTCRPVDIVEGILGRFKFATERDESTGMGRRRHGRNHLACDPGRSAGSPPSEDYIEHMIYRAKEEMGEIEPEDVPDPKSRDDGKVEEQVTLSTIHGARVENGPYRLFVRRLKNGFQCQAF